jgi:hypothetical protein
MASVRIPQPAPRAKEGEAPAAAPTSIAGLLSVFGGSKSEPEAPAPTAAPSAPAAQRSTLMAKTKQASPVFRTATAQAAPAKHDAKSQDGKSQESKPHDAPPLRLKQADKNEAPRGTDPQLRTAYSAPPAGDNGMLTGAQPVVPTGSFDSRWSGFR